MSTFTAHLHEKGPLSAARADAALKLDEIVFPVHTDYLESQSWIMQGLFECRNCPSEDKPVIVLRSSKCDGGLQFGRNMIEALDPVCLQDFLYHAYHPEAPLLYQESEQRVLNILSAAEFFSDDNMKTKCSIALAAAACEKLKGLHDPVPLAVSPHAITGMRGLELEDSAINVLKEHGSPVSHVHDEWDLEVNILKANNLKAHDREQLVRYLRIATGYKLPHLLAQCLPHLCKLVVAASSHHNLRHTVHECLPLLEDAAKVVMMFEIAQVASAAVDDAGWSGWHIDSQRVLDKLQAYQHAEDSRSTGSQ